MKNRIFAVLCGLVLALSNPPRAGAQGIVDNAQAQNALEQEAPLPEQAPLQPSEGQARTDSLDALDAEAARFAALAGWALNSLPPDALVLVGRFQLNEGDSLFETYWRRHLLNALANLENRRFLLITEDQAEADYRLDGVMLMIGDTLRIYTQLIRVRDAALMQTWVRDFLVRPFIQAMLPESGAALSGSAAPAPSGSAAATPDAYEPDGIDSPIGIEPDGAWLERTLHEGDGDWFAVIPNQDGMLMLEVAGGIAMYVTLYDAESGAVLARDNNGGGHNASIAYEAAAHKTYIAEVRSAGYETGAYQFRAHFARAGEAPPDALIEPNNSMDQAARIAAGEQVRGYFESGEDRDWYMISAEPGAYLIIYTVGTMDTFMTVYDQAGNTLDSDDDLGSGLNARLMLIVPPEGAVYAELVEYEGMRGSYMLRTELMAKGKSDAYEPDDDPSSAKPIALGEVQNRSFTIAEDPDYACFTVDEKGVYEIRTIGADAHLDSYIGLYRADTGGYIAEDNDGGDNYDACLRVELEPGDYVLEIYCMSDDPLSNNAYTLSLMFVAEGSD
jgi:hypothetical protein